MQSVLVASEWWSPQITTPAVPCSANCTVLLTLYQPVNEITTITMLYLESGGEGVFWKEEGGGASNLAAGSRPFATHNVM